MFAYCGNNPIGNSDSSGMRYCAAASVKDESVDDRKDSCAFQRQVSLNKKTVSYGAAKPYVPDDRTTLNCLGYVLGEDSYHYLGNTAFSDFSIENVVEKTILEVSKCGRGIRPLDCYDSPISNNEYRIALRTGPGDYHYMLQHSDGTWSHKPGACPSRLLNARNPSSALWNKPIIDEYAYYYSGIIDELSFDSNYYSSATYYFAISAY